MQKLEEYIAKGGRRLRLGYTTGSCAAAASGAAARLLLGGGRVETVSLKTPAGLVLTLDVEEQSHGRDWACCAVQKDPGDDPDVTGGMLIHAMVRKISEGIEITGGRGIGRVTKPGLSCEVGGAAINPVPLRMIRDQLKAVIKSFGYTGGLSAEIFAPRGEEIARRTFNPRLGIVGGISILGTSGIVEPMSEAALIDTVRADIDQKAALGAKALLIVPGNYGEAFARGQLGLDTKNAVKCSNHIGEALDHAAYRGIRQIVLIGHAGKLVKLAAGVMNTHSSVADARAEVLAAHAALRGASANHVAALMDAVTVDAADALLREWGMDREVWDSISEKVSYHLEHRLKGRAEIGFAAFAKTGVVMRSKNLKRLLDALKM